MTTLARCPDSDTYKVAPMNRGPFLVLLSALDHLNKASYYAFPNRPAADRFADAHRVGGRGVVVQEVGA